MRKYLRYRIIWATSWIDYDEDGEWCDEPEGGRMLCDTDCPEQALYLLGAWEMLAGHMYGEGVLCVVDGNLQGRRISCLHHCGPLPSLAG